MRKMRKIILPRLHSGRWLLSPEILTAYDEVWIHPEDARTVEKEASHSSYNEWEAVNLDILRRRFPEVLVVQSHSAHQLPTDKQVVTEADELIRLARPPRSQQLAPFSMKELVGSVIYAHKWWIRYNRNKLRLLDPNEKVSKLLSKELIPYWEDRITRLQRAKPEESLAMLKADAEIPVGYEKLVAAALRLIRSSTHIDVYDFMLPEYMPMIELIERKRRFHSHISQIASPCAIQPIIKWGRLRHRPLWQVSSLDEWINVLSSPSLNNISTLKLQLAELDALLKDLPVRLRPSREAIEWCRDVKSKCEKVEWLLKSEKNTTFLLGLLIFIASFGSISPEIKIVLRSLSGIRLARSSPGFREWWERNLTGMLAGAYGLNNRTGRFIVMMTDSLRYAGTTMKRLDPNRYAVTGEELAQHYWPFRTRLQGSASRE